MKYRVQYWRDKDMCTEREVETPTIIGLYDTYMKAYHEVEGLTNVTAVLIGGIAEDDYTMSKMSVND